jgi:hypothetical protein
LDPELYEETMSHLNPADYFLSKEYLLTNDQLSQALAKVEKDILTVPEIVTETLESSFGKGSKLEMYGRFIYWNIKRLNVAQSNLVTILDKFGWENYEIENVIVNMIRLLLSAKNNLLDKMHELELTRFNNLGENKKWKFIISTLSDPENRPSSTLETLHYSKWDSEKYIKYINNPVTWSLEDITATDKFVGIDLKDHSLDSVFETNKPQYDFACMITFAARLGREADVPKYSTNHDIFTDTSILVELLKHIDKKYHTENIASIKNDAEALLATIAYKWYQKRNRGAVLKKWENDAIDEVVNNLTSTPDAATEQTSTPAAAKKTAPAPAASTPPVTVDLTVKGTGSDGKWVKTDWEEAAKVLKIDTLGTVPILKARVIAKVKELADAGVEATTPTPAPDVAPDADTTPAPPPASEPASDDDDDDDTTPAPAAKPAAKPTPAATGSDWLDGKSYNALKVLSMLSISTDDNSYLTTDYPFRNKGDNEKSKTKIDTVMENLKKTIKPFSKMTPQQYYKDFDNIRKKYPEQMQAVIDNVIERTDQKVGWVPKDEDWPFVFAVNLGDAFTKAKKGNNPLEANKTTTNQLKGVAVELNVALPDDEDSPWLLMDSIFEKYYETK